MLRSARYESGGAPSYRTSSLAHLIRGLCNLQNHLARPPRDYQQEINNEDVQRLSKRRPWFVGRRTCVDDVKTGSLPAVVTSELSEITVNPNQPRRNSVGSTSGRANWCIAKSMPSFLSAHKLLRTLMPSDVLRRRRYPVTTQKAGLASSPTLQPSPADS